MGEIKKVVEECSWCNGNGYRSYPDDRDSYKSNLKCGCTDCGGGGEKYELEPAYRNIWTSRYQNEGFKEGTGKVEVTYERQDDYSWRYIDKKPYSGGCFVTTAVCEKLGKPDDCYELQTLRKLRDDYVAHLPGGRVIMRDYRMLSQTIIPKINNVKYPLHSADSIYSMLLPIISLTEDKMYPEAFCLYESMIKKLCELNDWSIVD